MKLQLMEKAQVVTFWGRPKIYSPVVFFTQKTIPHFLSDDDNSIRDHDPGGAADG